MNIREVLENYNTYKLRVSVIKGEIQDLQNEMYELKSANLDGMPKPKGFATSKLEDSIIKAQDKISEKQRCINRLENIIEIIENLVKTLKKYNQDIINMKYYQMMSIEEIAVIKGRGYGAIQKTIDRSISKMQKEYNKYKMY